MGYKARLINLPEGEEFAPPEQRVKEIRELLSPCVFPLGFSGTDRSQWEVVKSSSVGQDLLRGAKEIASLEPRLTVTNELYLRAIEEDSQAEHREIVRPQRKRMTLLPLAQCIDPTGEYLPIIEKDLQSILQLKSWINPLFDGAKKSYGGEVFFNDLTSLHYANLLIFADYLLGDWLQESIRKFIHVEVERRILKPYQQCIQTGQRAYWWVTEKNNWNSVCLACITACALYLCRDLDERAWYIALAEKLITHSEQGFSKCGFYLEGVNYWMYGFGHYILLSEIVRAATGGKIDWLKKPLVEKMTQHGIRIEVQNGAFPSMADCASDVVPATWSVHWMNNRIDDTRQRRSTDKAIDSLKGFQYQSPFQLLLILFHQVDISCPYERTLGERIRDWFEEVQFLICRPKKESRVKLAATVKGGDNGFNHNHNDIGTYTVLIDDEELLTDPGGEVYTTRTFSDHRYESNLLNSYGHPVPVVAGQLQMEGEEAYASVIDVSFSDGVDRVILDLKDAYRVGSLEKLIRHFTYDRAGDGSVEVMDDVSYTQPEAFEIALITYAEWERQEDGLLRVFKNQKSVEVTVFSLDGELEFHHCIINESSTPTRLAWRFKEPISHARIVTSIRPMMETIS